MDLRPGWVFYTPGDNEWTDCDDLDWEPPLSALESLVYLRKLIASRPMKLPDDWYYANQEEQKFPENARWTQGNVMFATVHIVGSNNGRKYIRKDGEKKTLKLVEARDKANLAWLENVFVEARKKKFKSGAVVIATQADVTKPDHTAPCSDSRPRRCDAFAEFRDKLSRHAARFNKPVLLIHGDTHPFCLDKNFGGAPNLWRLNALGDYTGVDATVITVQLGNQEEPFKIEPLITGALVDSKCR